MLLLLLLLFLFQFSGFAQSNVVIRQTEREGERGRERSDRETAGGE